MECPSGFERSLKTQKCIKTCAPHLIRNPSTGKCIRIRPAPAISSMPQAMQISYALPMRDGPFTYAQKEPSYEQGVRSNATTIPQLNSAFAFTEPISINGFSTSNMSNDPNIQYNFTEPKPKSKSISPFEEEEYEFSDDSYSYSAPSSVPSRMSSSRSSRMSSSVPSSAPSSAPSRRSDSGWLSSKSKTRSNKSKSKSASYQIPEAAWINPNIFNSLDKNANAYGTPPVSYQEIRPHSLDAVTHESMGTLGSYPSVRSMSSPTASTMQLEIDNLSDQIDKLIASNTGKLNHMAAEHTDINDKLKRMAADHTDINDKLKRMAADHTDIENKIGENTGHIMQLDRAVRTAARPNFVLLGYNGVENGAPVPVFAKTVNQEFSTQSLAAIGVDTKSNTPFYFVFRQLVHMRGPTGLPINLYEINQFASFCDHSLKVVVPVRSMKQGATKLTTNEKLVHTIAQTNGRQVSYESPASMSYESPSPSSNTASSSASFSTPLTTQGGGGGKRRRSNNHKRTQRRIFRLFN
jgi:hypothetical protein